MKSKFSLFIGVLLILAVFCFSLPSAIAEQVVTSSEIMITSVVSDSDIGIQRGEMQFSNDGINWSRKKAYARVEPNWNLTEYGGNKADGLKTIYGRFSDSLGNWTTRNNIKLVVLLDTTAPISSASSTSGVYANAQFVTLVCNDGFGSGCKATYYTTDGTEPTISSSRYREAIAVSGSTEIKYFSVDVGGNAEAVKSENYTILAKTIKSSTVPTVSEWGKILLFALILLRFARKSEEHVIVDE